MSFVRIRTLVPDCAICGDAWARDLENPPAFASTRRHALRCLVNNHGWRVSNRWFRRTRMFCPGCVQPGNCIRDGHNWEFRPAVETHHGTLGPFRACTRCPRAEALEVEPPLDHTDSMGELDEATEEMLAALDAELFPEEAI